MPRVSSSSAPFPDSAYEDDYELDSEFDECDVEYDFEEADLLRVSLNELLPDHICCDEDEGDEEEILFPDGDDDPLDDEEDLAASSGGDFNSKLAK